MRNEILRDVLAGCAGVLLVAAAIGLPKDSTAARPGQEQVQQLQNTELLPYYSSTLRHPLSPRILHQPVLPVRPTP
jgi:hypothetical protein